jgi:hypothetical protein
MVRRLVLDQVQIPNNAKENADRSLNISPRIPLASTRFAMAATRIFSAFCDTVQRLMADFDDRATDAITEKTENCGRAFVAENRHGSGADAARRSLTQAG